MSENKGRSSNERGIQVLPPPRVAMRVRVATVEDQPWIDALQKMHTHMVGWFPTKQMRAYIEGEHVLIAEREEPDAERVGYIVYKDEYLKRDEVGIIYQLNVAPIEQRQLIGATLVRAAFERAAFGCKLFCCWCAQDIQANWFWESIGFVPLAFRTGSRGKQRIHIFWQKRIREGDESTPWWFPYQTAAGAVREDRIVLPIPFGTHWRDAKPMVLPGGPERVEVEERSELEEGENKRPELPAAMQTRPPESRVHERRAQQAAVMRSKSKHLQGTPAGKAAIVTAGGVRFVSRTDGPSDEELAASAAAEEEAKCKPKPKRKKKRRRVTKHDAEHVRMARELRDRYLAAVQDDPTLLLPMMEAQKYEVSRWLLEDQRDVVEQTKQQRLLDAA